MATPVFIEQTRALELKKSRVFFLEGFTDEKFRGLGDGKLFEESKVLLSAFSKIWADKGKFPTVEQTKIYGAIRHQDANFGNFHSISAEKVKKLRKVTIGSDSVQMQEFKGTQARVAFFTLGTECFCVFGIRKKQDDWTEGDLKRAENQATLVYEQVKKREFFHHES